MRTTLIDTEKYYSYAVRAKLTKTVSHKRTGCLCFTEY
jgi:hypothetical protein